MGRFVMLLIEPGEDDQARNQVGVFCLQEAVCKTTG